MTTDLDRAMAEGRPAPSQPAPPKRGWLGNLTRREADQAPEPSLVRDQSPPASAETALPPHRLTWREKRWERRRRRHFFEEILGWIVVPLILLALYWAVTSTLAAFGTSPGALIEGVKSLL